MPQFPAFDVMTATCPSRTSLARIANKWTAMVVIALSAGHMRFRDLRTSVDGISAKVLTETLRDLERDGLVTQHVYGEVPPRVEYELTEKGSDLLPVIDAMRGFGHKWLVEEHGHTHDEPPDVRVAAV